jgi:hypothetical protein
MGVCAQAHTVCSVMCVICSPPALLALMLSLHLSWVGLVKLQCFDGWSFTGNKR